MKMQQQSIPVETLILAGLSDKVSLLLWAKTEDGQKGRNRPAMILDALNPISEKPKDALVFNSGEDFERVRKELISQVEKEVAVDGD